jgi:hypothetical protein
MGKGGISNAFLGNRYQAEAASRHQEIDAFYDEALRLNDFHYQRMYASRIGTLIILYSMVLLGNAVFSGTKLMGVVGVVSGTLILSSRKIGEFVAQRWIGGR